MYAVGGAVRDRLLGIPVKDRDYVVVGATPEDMAAQGFRPVGKDFPVFLHPDTQEEYALARTERKTARGYKGFAVYATPQVTLEEDLRRRDLTINALAEDEQGRIVDPYGGRADLTARILRHVSDAFVEDPVRILRVARFAARFPNFTLAPETLELMRRMVADGEVDALVPERTWQELSRGLMERRPSRLLETLRACGALARILPEVDRLFGVPQRPEIHPEVDTGAHVLRVIDETADKDYSLPVRWAALVHDLGKGLTEPARWPSHMGHEAQGAALVEPIGARLRVPRECTELARVVAEWHGEIHQALQLDPADLLALLEHTDAMRRPDRFEQVLQACAADFRGRPGFEADAYAQAERLGRALSLVRSVDAGAIAQATPLKSDVPVAIRAARLETLSLGI